MKKGLTIGIALITTLSLAACGNSQTKSDKAKKDSSSLVAKKKAHAKKESIKKAKATSESKAKAESESVAASSSAVSRSSKLAQASQSSSQASSSSYSPTQQSSSVSTDPTTLTGFVNKYGESPAAYKMDHDGMTAQQALDATPDNMETSGEIQLEHSPQN